MAAKKNPYLRLPRPPQGTYDPAIDASGRAAQRGYGDLQRDTTTQNTRAASDYGIALADAGRQRDYGLADILRSQTRAGQDLNTQGGQLQQDYTRGLADILTQRENVDRQYGVLANNQLQAANTSGDIGGGVLAQSLAKRQSNEALAMQPLDTQQQRLGENHAQAVAQLTQTGQRQGEDIATQRQRLTTQYGTGGTDYGLTGQQASLTYQRGVQDRATQLGRAGREMNAYQQDLIPTRYYSAAGLTTYTPPKLKGGKRR